MRGSYLNDPCRELRSGEPDDDRTPPSPADQIADTIDMCAQICEERADELPFGQAQAELRALAKDLRDGKVPTGLKQCASCGIWTKERPDGWDLPDWNYCQECEARKL